MYAGKKEEDKTETKKVLKNKKPIKIQITNNNVNNKINTLNSREMTNINPSMSLTSTNKFITDKNIIKNRLLSKDKKTYKKNMCFSVRKFRKKLDIDKKLNLPFIKPREIIIEYQLTNDAGISKENKNLGHNHYMGSFYNPQNYFVNSKNRTKRNVFGGLFTN